ncbi:hypothetical protein BCR42DRAFT_487083 [Absidia repens]|uniref:Uncharacterized protein n=1 Tax=Absidia repens TaxID=90262 RepID=A0A1X2IVK6_9FUNG|nr:hypothetical protein BCR42DRAFT_487083 [Absidia repens]
MNICANRLKTFTQHEPPWPYINDNAYHTAEEFAHAGFYNVSTKRSIDKVKCYLCNIILADWKQGQSPLGRHAHAAKTCPLVLLNFPDALTTIPIQDQDANTHPEGEFMLKTRLKTFTKNKAWPPHLVTDNTQQLQTRHSTKQRSYPTANKMAEAGFVFLPTLNEPDRAKCPYCQHCVVNLSATSNPWIQHQRANSGCPFVTRYRVTLPSKRSSLPQKRSTPAEASTTTSKRSRRATTNPNLRDNTPETVDDHDRNAETDNDINDIGQLSRFDDSIWDIAKAQLEYKQLPDLATGNQQRPSNAKPLVTYERKKHKRSSKVLPPELTKPTISTNAQQSKDSANSSRTKKHAISARSSQQKQTTGAASTANQQKETDETPAEVLAKLQKQPTKSTSSKDKGKGRASDFTATLAPAPSTTENLGRHSFRLSTDNKKTTGKSSSAAKSSELASTSSTSASTVKVSATASHSAPFTTNKPTITQQQQSNGVLCSTPSHRRSNLNSSTPLPHSTPIHSRIDHGKDLMALTLSPIRGTGNMTATANVNVNHLGGVFGNLETPMTTNYRTGQQNDDDIGYQIEQRFRAKRRLGSPSKSTPLQQQRNENGLAAAATKKASDTYYGGTPLLDFDDLDEETVGTINNYGANLTQEQLAMTVEGFIQNLVERKVTDVKKHGEQLIKNIQQEVADTKKSILANHL